jgi:bifunctional non-homologous end joining protein LigD
MPPQDPLARYWAKRNFAVTSEPRGDVAASGTSLAFVIQKHHASRLHYDLRLEWGGVMWSWAVPKGPSFDPTDKRMAIHVEDHPISYNTFEGTIPRGQYGAGTVIVWDEGTWEPAVDPQQGLKDGKLVFTLHGHKLAGLWELVRIAKPGDKQDAWLLFKKRDRHAKPRTEYDVVSALPDSVIAKPLKATTGSAGPTGAVKAPLPATLPPQLASLASAAPTSGAWAYEIKLDGYRLMARIEDGKARLITRGGHDWSSKMPALVKAVQSLGLKSAWLDGEIVVMNDKTGTPDFNALQNAFDRSRTERIDYFLFDLPYFEGHDLRATPLVQRRQLLQQLLDEHPHEHLRFSADFDADAASILESARRMGLEGVIAKRKDAPYESRRTETWLKLKNKLRQEFVVAGYTDRSSGEAEIGSTTMPGSSCTSATWAPAGTRPPRRS